RLSELIEWTITWALLLAMHKLSNSLATSSVSTAAQFAVIVLQEVLFAGPIAYLMLRPKLNAASFALSVVAAAAATVIWMLAHGSYVKLAVVMQSWPQGAWAGFVFWLFLTAHFLVIRSLGYRLNV